ncbi:hypothetical protein HIM_06063 [Hirsutella minnesotensis 3608]|uniref:Uncharacterized protein n=1 Tax=Hirsutella minnesotensis 3608 TaxID=1043627 RepID=A0A0F7ZZM2_9HYPO|nr:hypothetical protein HIM_06063 [Hirsutella minnesotensis 3608]
MEDPWGDPWATDTPAKINLPAAPRGAYFATDRIVSPRRSQADASSPWHQDDEGSGADHDAWNGWGDAAASRLGAGWGRSPGLKPLAGALDLNSFSAPSLHPWTDAAADVRGADAKSENSLAEGTAVKARDETVDAGHTAPKPQEDLPVKTPLRLHHDVHEIWGDQGATDDDPLADEAASERGPESTVQEPQRSESPDGIPRRAIGGQVRTETGRQASKVQELVEMYDGMARRRVSPPASVVTVMKKQDDVARDSLPTPEDDLPESPVVDVVKASHDTDQADTSREEESIRPETVEQQSIPLKPVDEPKPVNEDSSAPPEAWTEQSSWEMKDKPPQSLFSVDLSLLDELFPSDQSIPSQQDEEPSSHSISRELFNTVSERRAWYRISRFSSMRRYDQGDEDDYVRVSWGVSRVRERTLGIVRQWMEQDSLGGRVVLGRRVGTGGASMFNWDSAAAPVEIGELFKKKSGAASASVPGQVLRPGSAALPPVGSLAGWGDDPSVSPPVGPMSAPASGQFDVKSIKSPREFPGTDKNASFEWQFPPPPVVPVLEKAPAVEVVQHQEEAEEAQAEEPSVHDDEEDDWGEMVGPVDAEAPSGITSAFSVPEDTGMSHAQYGQDMLSPDRFISRKSSSIGNTEDSIEDRALISPGGESLGEWTVSTDLVPFATLASSPRPSDSRPTITVKAVASKDDPFVDDATWCRWDSGADAGDFFNMRQANAKEKKTTDGEDAIVAKILKSLPDLSYMLR